MATFQEILAQGQARERAANPDKMAWLDRYNAMPQGPGAVFNPVKPGDPLPYNPTGVTNPSNAAEMSAFQNSPEGKSRQAMYQEGLAKGYIPKPSHGWMDTLSRGVDYAIQGVTMAGIGGGLAGIAGVGPAAAGAGGSGAVASGGMAGMGSGAMSTAGGGLASTGTAAAGGAAGAGGAAAGGAGMSLLGGANGFTPAMNAAGMAAGGNAAGVGVGGSSLGATAAGGAALNSAAGSSGGWFPNFAEGLGGSSGALSGQNLLNLGVGAGVDALAADRQRNQANSAADKAAGLADPFASQRPQYQAQLSNLMQHPESINQDPSYQFRLKSGQDALERSNVSKGFLGSGNMAMDLQNYGQQSASQELNNQYSRLAQLSGGNAGAGYAGNVFGGLANTGLANSAQINSSLGTAGGALINRLTGTGSTGNNNVQYIV